MRVRHCDAVDSTLPSPPCRVRRQLTVLYSGRCIRFLLCCRMQYTRSFCLFLFLFFVFDFFLGGGGGGFSKDSRGKLKRAREGSANKLKPHMHVGVSPQFHSSIFTLAPDLSRRARASTDQHKKRVLCCCLTTASVLPKL